MKRGEAGRLVKLAEGLSDDLHGQEVRWKYVEMLAQAERCALGEKIIHRAAISTHRSLDESALKAYVTYCRDRTTAVSKVFDAVLRLDIKPWTLRWILPIVAESGRVEHALTWLRTIPDLDDQAATLAQIAHDVPQPPTPTQRAMLEQMLEEPP